MIFLILKAMCSDVLTVGTSTIELLDKQRQSKHQLVCGFLFFFSRCNDF